MSTHSFDTFEVKRSKSNSGDIVLSEDQKAVYDKILDWYRRPSDLLTVGGYAGTGKTTLLAKLIRDVGGRSFLCAAYTGKAANVLGQKLDGVSVTTIHSAIYRPFEREDGTTGFSRKWSDEAGASGRIFVIDEASMVGEGIFADIKSLGRPVLAIGDHGQLPPIEGPSVLMKDPMLRLEKIHRQAEGSPIIQLSKTIREKGRVPVPPPKGIRSLSWGMFQAEINERVPYMTDAELHDFAVLCYKNATRVRVNKLVREARYGIGILDSEPQKGDVVVCLRNQPPIYNGMRGTLEQIDKRMMAKVRFPDDGILHEGPIVSAQFGRPETFKNVSELREAGIKNVFRDVREAGAFYDYGYCLTVHKAQGSGFKTVYWIKERSRADDDTYQRWMYTAVTRAVDELVIVAG